MNCSSRGEEEGRKKAGSLNPAAGRAAQAVMRAATADPLRDSQLERVVKLPLGKRVPAAGATSKAATAHAASAATGGGDPSLASAPAMEPAGNHQAEQRVESEDEGESLASDLTGPRGSPPAAQSSSGTPVAQLSGTALPAKAAATTQGGRKKNRAARRAARAAWEAEDGSPTAGGDQAPPVMWSPQGKKQCPSSVGCEIAGKGSNCPAEGCNRPHHVTLHGILKAGKSSLLAKGTDPPDEPTVAAANRVPEMAKQLRGLLGSLGRDPDALEVRIGIRKPGEQGQPRGSEAIDPGAGDGRLTGKLLEALTLLCQAGERFMDSAGESRRRMIETTGSTAVPRENTRGERGRSATRDGEHASRRGGSRMAHREPAARDGEDSADEDGERR